MFRVPPICTDFSNIFNIIIIIIIIFSVLLSKRRIRDAIFAFMKYLFKESKSTRFH